MQKKLETEHKELLKKLYYSFLKEICGVFRINIKKVMTCSKLIYM